MDFAESLFFSSNALNRQLNTMADDAFRELGLTSSYAFLLMMVNDQPGIQPMDLSKKLGLTPSTITRLVEKMEYRGYVNRRSEGRSTHIKVTEKGEQLCTKLEQAWVNLKRSYTSILGDRYTKVLSEMTYKASEQIRETR